jgi:hypothetical protein
MLAVTAKGGRIMQTLGFRRLVVALCAGWLLVAGGVLAYELMTHQVGYFVEMTLPVGTVVQGSQATLPDGRVVHLETTIAPSASDPGRLYWATDPAVAELHVQRALFAVAFGIPIIAWLGIDALALTAGWIGRGFKRPPHPATH